MESIDSEAVVHPSEHMAAIPTQSGEGYFDLADFRPRSRNASPATSGRCSTMSIQMPPSQFAMDTAFTALQYLPMPLLVLSSNKTIVVANEAMGRLLGIDHSVSTDTPPQNGPSGLARMPLGPLTTNDTLHGLHVGAIGIDILSNGSPVYVTWEDFLSSVLADALDAIKAAVSTDSAPSGQPGGDLTPKLSASGEDSETHKASSSFVERAVVHEVVVDVAFSTSRDPTTGLPYASKEESHKRTTTTGSQHVEANLIISVWFMEGIEHYTLTFTAAHNRTTAAQQKGSQRTVTRMPRTYLSGMGSGSSTSSGGKKYASSAASPGSGISPWLPNAPASSISTTTTSTMLSKTSRLKDSMLNALAMPVYAMWKDESVGVPNLAALKILGGAGDDGNGSDQRDFLSQYTLFKGDFSRALRLDEYPIMVLMRNQKGFKNMRIAMLNHGTGDRLLYDVDGEEILDEKTKEFLGGAVVFKDVTTYAQTISEQKRENASQFEDIANKVPVLVWTTRPDGYHDFFSQRWYDYTGLTPEECMGTMWKSPFKAEDVEIAMVKWQHSLATGEEYNTEYRCRSKEGEWRWMLGKALPMRDATGKIVKWFVHALRRDLFPTEDSLTELCQVRNVHRHSRSRAGTRRREANTRATPEGHRVRKDYTLGDRQGEATCSTRRLADLGL